MDKIQNAMTVDVEEYYQVSAFEKAIDRKEWESINSSVENNVARILSLFDDKQVKATFFVLGWVAERHPQMIKSIVQNGHELASHGYSHIRVANQNKEEFREDVSKTKKILEDISGESVVGYRAASFSINSVEHWAHSELLESGYKYSSSVYPVVHDLYGVPDAPGHAYRPFDAELLEIPLSALKFCGLRVPCSGGGYFRLFPYSLSNYLINTYNKREKRPGIFYFHPWEIDTEQPRLDNINLKTRFRHYNGLEKMEGRLSKLCQSFTWNRMDKIFLDYSVS